MKRLLLFCFVFLCTVLPAMATVTANFTDGNTSSAVDGYVGMAGAGWTSPWTLNKGSATYVTFTNTVTTSYPLNGGGNYLSVALSNTNTSTDYGGAVTRIFDASVVNPSKAYELSFDFRGDSDIHQNSSDTNSQYAFFGSASGAAYGLDANTTWAIAASYSSADGVCWRYYNGSGTLVSTGIPYLVGTIYHFVISIDPVAHTYCFTISDGATYSSPSNLGFRNPVTGVNQVFFSTKDDKDHTGAVTFSIDSIAIPTNISPGSPGWPWASFTAGETTSAIDGYGGTAGAGWTAPWTINKGSATYITLSNAVTSSAPLNDGSNYLSVAVSNSSALSDYGGAVTRTFDPAVVDNSKPYQLAFDFRGDTNINQNGNDTNSQYAIIGSAAANASGLDTNTTWAIIASYSGTDGVCWRYYNGSGTLYSTGIACTTGTTYHFLVTIDPAAHTYCFTISGGATYSSPANLGFRNPVTGLNKVFFTAKDDKDHTGSVAFSLDTITLKPSGRVHQGWPMSIVPQAHGAAMHLNTHIDFGMPTNNPAMSQFRDANYKFARFCIPWFDVERSMGQFNYTSPQSYIPGYQQYMDLLKNRSLRPIICLAFGNTLYGTNTNNGGIVTEAQRQAFQNYCFSIAYTFRDWDPIFEIWNEPNLNSFWYPLADVDQYMAMVPYAINGIKQGWHYQETQNNPEPLIIAPSVANSWARGNFIDQCFDRGLLNLVDGISFHPYFDTHPDPAKRIPESLALPTIIPAVKAELTARGKPNLPIVITEWGWSTAGGSYAVTPETQAKYAVRQILMGYYTGVTINCIYSMDDARNANDYTEGKHYGLFTTMGADFQKILTAKPAIAAVTVLNAQLAGHQYVERVNMGDVSPLNSANDWCLVFWNPTTSTAKVVLWTTETGIQKTSPDLMPLMGLSESKIVTFTDSPVVADVVGYTP